MARSISRADNSFSSVETTFYLFFKYYPVENRLEQIHELRGTINDENLLLMIPELHTSVASCFPIKVITNMAFFQFCIYFGILVLLNQKKVIPLSYHVQATFINKKILVALNCMRFILQRNAKFLEFGFSNRSNNNATVNAVPLYFFRKNQRIIF